MFAFSFWAATFHARDCYAVAPLRYVSREPSSSVIARASMELPGLFPVGGRGVENLL
jgi:hypothetical protein